MLLCWWWPILRMLHLEYEMCSCQRVDQDCMISSWLWRIEGEIFEKVV